MPVYKYRNNKGLFYLVKVSLSGKQYMKRGFSSRKEASIWETAFLAKDGEDISVSVLFASYLDWYRRSFKSSSFHTLERMFSNHFSFFLECHKKVTFLSLSCFSDWWKNICKDPSLKDKNLYLTYLKKVFSFGRDYFGVTNRNVYRLPLYHDYSEQVAKSKRIVSSEEFFRVLGFAPAKFQLVFMAAYLFGLRIGEVRGLLVRNVDLENGKLFVLGQCQYVKGKNVLTSTKSKSSTRFYVLPRFFLEALGNWIRDNSLKADDFLFFGVSRKDPVSQVSINRCLHSCQEKAGVVYFPFHSFRKSSASFLNDEGINGKWIAEFLGHSSDEVTKKYYLGSTDEKLGKISSLLDSRFSEGFEKSFRKETK